MKRYLIFPFLFAIPFWVLVLAAVGVGQVLGAASDAFRADPDCQLPCWNGIQPGVTEVKVADSILKSMGYALHDSRVDHANSLPNQTTYDAPSGTTVCQVGISRARAVVLVVSDLTLRLCGEAPLGHVIDLLGDPESFVPYVSMVTYQQGAVSIILRSELCDQPPSPHSPILFLSLTPPINLTQNAAVRAEQATGGDDLELLSSQVPWRGFLPIWRYFQLYPDRVMC